MPFSGIVTKEDVASPELRGMKCKELRRHFFFFLTIVFQELAKTEVLFLSLSDQKKKKKNR